jgi:hypothetical protein
MKTFNIWKCEDCYSTGFYYGLTDEEIREKHSSECKEKVELPATRWPEGAEL